jgi:hypothetical protein
VLPVFMMVASIGFFLYHLHAFPEQLRVRFQAVGPCAPAGTVLGRPPAAENFGAGYVHNVRVGSELQTADVDAHDAARSDGDVQRDDLGTRSSVVSLEKSGLRPDGGASYWNRAAYSPPDRTTF